MIPSPPSPERVRSVAPALTRQRLLDAAALVFSRDGIQGATTREISREAGVNEVTLFRHFRTREELLRATLEHALGAEGEMLHLIGDWNQGLRPGLTKFVREYNALLERKEALARAVIAEARLLPESLRTMIIELVRPHKLQLQKVLADAQAAGAIRPDVNLECFVDLIRDVLQAGMLRRTGFPAARYSTDEYLATVVNVLARGLEPAKSQEVYGTDN